MFATQLSGITLPQHTTTDMKTGYIRTLIHVLRFWLLAINTVSYSSIDYILVRLVCTQPTTLLTSIVGLVLSRDFNYLIGYYYGAWLAQNTKQYIRSTPSTIGL